jgi:ribosomal protein S18 acetylase RimI-like enzyme
MEIVTLNESNIGQEHICCAISDKKCVEGYNLKKDWLKQQFKRGYTFKKYDVKHKVFIEYGPAKDAWYPIDASNYMLINCFWVAGRYKGQGYGKKLLMECLNDAKKMNGAIVLSSNKKRPFLADKKFFIKQGFEVCDTAPPYFELLVKKNVAHAPEPKFRKNAEKNKIENEKGLTVLYTNQCPFTEYYVNEELQTIADSYKIPLNIIKITSKKDAQNMPSAFPIYNVFYNGEFLAHEILSKKRFDKLWEGIKG